jgi:hypothetical protein
MRFVAWIGISAIVFTSVFLALASFRNSVPRPAREPKRIHVVLVGASIGQAWQLAAWSVRMQARGFSAESVAVWKFDKSPAIEQLLARPATSFSLSRAYLRSLVVPPPKPDVVILKECSSYFPGDLAVYQNSVRTWVDQLQAHRIKVVLATVVPVTKARAQRDPGKQESLLAYNRWVRQYALQERIPVVDLEASLRTEGEGGYLRDEFAAEDGSHLIAPAYAALDHTLFTTLCAQIPGAACLAQ